MVPMVDYIDFIDHIDTLPVLSALRTALMFFIVINQTPPVSSSPRLSLPNPRGPSGPPGHGLPPGPAPPLLLPRTSPQPRAGRPPRPPGAPGRRPSGGDGGGTELQLGQSGVAAAGRVRMSLPARGSRRGSPPGGAAPRGDGPVRVWRGPGEGLSLILMRA